MKRTLAFLMTLVFMVSVLSACGGSGGTGEPAAPAESQAAASAEASAEAPAPEEATPEGGPVPIDSPLNRPVVTDINGGSATSDPYNHSALNDRIWQGNCFDALFYYNGLTGEHEPRIGKSYTISDDGLRYDIEIRDDVYFHNGDHLTSADVKASYEYARTISFAALYIGPVKDVEIVDDYNLTIVLNKPDASFLISSDYLYILNTKVIEEQGGDFGTKVHLAGTGPYMIDYYDPNTEIRLVRNDNWYGGQAQIPGITYRVMVDPSATLIAFEAGELDIINNMLPANFKAIDGSGNYTTHIGDSNQVSYIMINEMKGGPLANKLVRQAMGYAINYESVLIGTREGYGLITGKFYVPSMKGAPDMNREGSIKYTYDPEKAKELLAEAGYPDGVDIGPMSAIAGNGEKQMQIIQASLAEVGITSTIEVGEQVTQIFDYYKGNYGVGSVSTTYMYDFDGTGRSCRISNDAAGPVKTKGATTFDAERIEELYTLGVSVTDEAERRAYYEEIDDIIMDAAIWLPLFTNQNIHAWNKKLVIPQESKSQPFHMTYLYDAYWTE